MQSYKVSADDAAAMAKQWYAMAGVTNPSPQALAHWTTQIQQDGSQPSYDLFKTGKGQDSADAFNPQTLAQHAAAYTAQTGKQPFTPTSGQFAGQNQLPGTNHKTALAEAQEPVGNFLKNIAPLAAVIPGLGPLISAGIGALGQSIIPGANLGDAVKQGAVSGAEGLAAGGVGSLVSGLTSGAGAGAGGAAAGAVPDAASMSPDALASAASAVPGAAGGALGAGGGADALGINGLSWGDLLKGVGGVASGISNYAQNQAQLAEKQREFNTGTGLEAQSQLNRAPLADMGQYLAMHVQAPTAFQPRDYTQPGGFANLNTPATGGPAAQLAANTVAQHNYTPGAGGVDTSTLQMILSKLNPNYRMPTPTTTG